MFLIASTYHKRISWRCCVDPGAFAVDPVAWTALNISRRWRIASVVAPARCGLSICDSSASAFHDTRTRTRRTFEVFYVVCFSLAMLFVSSSLLGLLRLSRFSCAFLKFLLNFQNIFLKFFFSSPQILLVPLRWTQSRGLCGLSQFRLLRQPRSLCSRILDRPSRRFPPSRSELPSSVRKLEELSQVFFGFWWIWVVWWGNW